MRGGKDIGAITVNHDLLGNTTNPVVISARGQAVPTATTDVAIQSLTVRGLVQYTNILAGYDVDGNPVNGDAQIGDVIVDRDWIASNLVAGVMAGADGLFGTADDAIIPGGSPGIIARINSITINGQVSGTPAAVNSTDHFGIVAEEIGSLRINV